MATLAGTTLDKYEMLEEVGHGGMAVVYRGRDSVLDREVAVKVLHPHLADREESRLRLQREAIAVAKLRHENILEIFDYSGPEAAESYIVTEFIHGPTLREWIESGAEPRPAVAAMIVHRLCLALCHAHKGAIVHRDIKPENVMIRLEDGVIKLMDFGIAQIIDNKKLTLTGQLIGSPAYMAPELISGRPLDARTDLFSLGILLYQLATGELPFNGRNPHEVLTRIADGQYPPPSTVCPLVDRDLEAIIDRSLALNPDERYQSVETFAKELEEYLGEMGIEPSATELCGYFRNPEKYIAHLDERVCKELLQQAEQAAAGGSTARAIRLLGRVVELEPEHAGAKAMLARLQLRERRSRQLLLGAAGLALAGLVGAGYMLMPEGTGTGRALAAGDPRQPGMSAMDPVDDGGEGRAGEDGRAGEGRTGGEGADAELPAVDSAAAADGPIADDAGDGEDGRPGEAGDGPVADDGAAAGDGGPKPRTEVIVRPRDGKQRPPRPETDGPVPCTITLAGLPKAQVSATKLDVAGTAIRIKDTVVDVELPAEGAQVKIDNSRYQGSRRVNPHHCPATLTVDPRPAAVQFTGIPDGTVAHCESGCSGGKDGKNQVASSFADIDLDDPTGQLVKVTFRHPDYKDKTESFIVQPGSNRVSITLEPRPEPPGG